MIVEDNELNMKLFHDLLDAHGYRTLQTRTGMEALRLAREQRPDLILMDIQLPGMDGLTATRHLKADPTTRDIPVLAVTSYAMKGDEAKALEAGCSGYVTKPIDKRVFLEAVAKALANREGK
jgi:two-component system cell cycle response regulator DivK